MISKKSLSAAAGSVLTALLLVLAYRYIHDLVSQINFEDIKIRWGFMVLSVGVMAVCYLLFSANWFFSCRLLNSRISGRQFLAFLASQPYKYLPTSLFTFSYRAVYGKKLGLTIKQSSFAQVFENISLLSSNVILFMVLYLATISVAYSFALIAIVVLIFSWILKDKPEINLSLRGKRLRIVMADIVRMYCLATAGWIFSGLAFIFLNVSLGLPVSFFEFMAANTIAFSLSILAFFAPGGIGVREVVYGFFSINSIAIVYWRVLTFVLDFLLGILAIVIVKKYSSAKH